VDELGHRRDQGELALDGRLGAGAGREADDERDEHDQRDRMSHAELSFSQWRERSTARRQPS